jgi:hypothetical protein
MATTVFKVLRALSGFESGRACRSCNEPIPAHDYFGVSEGVCTPCRDAPESWAAAA